MPDQQVRLCKSVVGEREADAARRVIVENGFFGMGGEVAAFERELSSFLETEREVVCTSTGTAALHLALQACGIGAGDEVLAPTVTFIATFQAISATGATVVPCDVREQDCWLDLSDAERRITPHTKAILPVHYAGGPGDLTALYELAKRYKLRVIEDATHAFGSRYEGKRVGSIGDIACFSFDGIKNITAGEGGAVVTEDRALAERVREGRLLGIHIGGETRIGNQRWDFDVFDQGWRYHMSDLFAAIGRVQLSRFESEFAPRRIELARRYDQLLGVLEDVNPMAFDYDEIVPFNYAVRFTAGQRDRVRDELMAHGIECGLYYKPLHLLTRYGAGRVRLPAAERIFRDILTLPLHPELSDADQATVVEVVAQAVRARELVGSVM
ncbi:MAG TPA: DegT/DnrJ/EryC1/StrS family aminotransferase [Dehalococcoidia bacterium]|nr:DegT/DnrJ/EryC1/StrS family aminotransferase [Dehalococcoidia bacterium]